MSKEEQPVDYQRDTCKKQQIILEGNAGLVQEFTIQRQTHFIKDTLDLL